MTWLFILLALAVVGVAAGVVTGRITGGMDAPPPSAPFRGLPAGDVRAEDLDDLRFTPVVRGYRMDEVDEVLDRLGDELARRDDELQQLRSQLYGEPYPAPAAAGPDAEAVDGDVVPGSGSAGDEPDGAPEGAWGDVRPGRY